MTTALVLTAINSGDATTCEGIRLRLHVAGVEVPDLQNILDGLLFVGTIKRSFAPNMNAMVYELTEQRKWEPEGTTEIVSIRAKHPERKLDWNKAILDGPTATTPEQLEQLLQYKRPKRGEVHVTSNPMSHDADIWRYALMTDKMVKPSGFHVEPLNKPKPEPKKALDLESAILAVIGHDGPSAIKIFQRVKNNLHLKDSELNFYDIRTTLDEMKTKHLVGYVKATEETNGGWIQLRIPKAFKK